MKSPAKKKSKPAPSAKAAPRSAKASHSKPAPPTRAARSKAPVKSQAPASTKAAAPSPMIAKQSSPAPRSAGKTPVASIKPGPTTNIAKPPAAKSGARPRGSIPATPKSEIPEILLEGDRPAAARIGGPGTRYDLGTTTRSSVGPGDEPLLPAAYGTRNIWLVPRDPQWLYAHWDFNESQQREYNQLSRDGHLILRIHDTEQPAQAVTEVHLHPESRSWFAHVGKGGHRYFAVLGFRDKTGEWNEINRSTAVGTPPDSLSPESAATFVMVSPEGGTAERIAAAGSARPPTAAAPIPSPASIPSPAPPSPPSLPQPSQADLHEFETWAELVRAVRDFLAGEPALNPAIEAVRSSDHPQLQQRLELPPPSEFVRWSPEQQQALAEWMATEVVRRVAGSQSWGAVMAAALFASQRSPLASAAAVPVPLPGPGGAISSPAHAISSPPGAPKQAARSFWFNVNAELIVYGATEASASVKVGDRPVRLREDGTFSCRFALPDGWYGLPVSATSADQVETRRASLKFMRQSEYAP